MVGIKASSVALYTIVRREMVRFLRIWTQTLVPPTITMSLYFIIFGNLIGPRVGSMAGFRYIDYIVPGLIMMAVITNAYANVVASFFGTKFQRSLEELLVSPMSNNVIISGYVLGGVARGVLVGLLVTVVSVGFTKLQIRHIGFTILIGFLTSVLFAIAGLINAILARKFDDINIVPTFILTPLTYLGGVFYSIELLSPFWQTVSYLNPVLYIVNAFRYGMLGHSEMDIQMSVTVIMGCVMVLYCLSLWMLNKGIGIRT